MLQLQSLHQLGVIIIALPITASSLLIVFNVKLLSPARILLTNDSFMQRPLHLPGKLERVQRMPLGFDWLLIYKVEDENA